MTVATEEVKGTEQDQTVQPGVETEGTEAGKEIDGEVTAATEETDETKTEGDGFSIEDIGSDAEVKEAADALKLDGLSAESQERVNKKIIGANNDKKIAQEKEQKANARVTELEAELATKSAPTDRPKMPLERNFDDDESYQKAVDGYQDDTIVYNAAVKNVETQEVVQAERVKINDDRLVSQMAELQEKYPDTDIKETIGVVANEQRNGTGQGFGNAAPFIADSEHSGRIALFLAKNESERARIGILIDVGSINREIGKLEERFTSVRKKTTNAPKPLSTIDNKTETTEKKSIYEIKDNSEFLKARNKEIRGRK